MACVEYDMAFKDTPTWCTMHAMWGFMPPVKKIVDNTLIIRSRYLKIKIRREEG